MRNCIVIALSCIFAAFAHSGEQSIRIAVASNFYGTMATLKTDFLATHPNAKVDLISGSTGKLYSQIIAKAPFDLFFAADTERPRRLEDENRIQPGNRITYAIGVLALWSKTNALDGADGANILRNAAYDKLAIANPKLAPYGKASIDFLNTFDLFELTKSKLVYGENVSQPFHFAQTGAADFAFISFASIANNPNIGGSHWLPPSSSYEPIEQQAALLSSNALARDFFEFIKSPSGRAIIEHAGYRLP